MGREEEGAEVQDVFGSDRSGGLGVGLRLQADKHLGIPDHPWESSHQVTSCNSSGLDRKQTQWWLSLGKLVAQGLMIMN